MKQGKFKPCGVIPACLLPFNRDMSINEAELRNHLLDVAGVTGISAITVNGHSMEIHALELDEQKLVVEIAKDTLPADLPIVCGVFTNSSIKAGKIARMAELAGADCLLIFPPDSLTFGDHIKSDMVKRHFSCIADQSELPIIVFQYPVRSGLAYPLGTLLELCEHFPQIVAVKDFLGEPKLHEQQIRELQGLSRPVNTLTTHSSWLLGSLALGCQGILSGAGSVIADLQVGLFNAVWQNDLATAKAINNRIYPMVRAFYDAPLVDMHNRMKEALAVLGKLRHTTVRPPLVKLGKPEIARIENLLKEAQVTKDNVYSFVYQRETSGEVSTRKTGKA